MANGQGPGVGGLPGLFQQGGKWGGAGLIFASLGYLAKYLLAKPRDINDLLHFFTGSGTGLAMLGVSTQVTRGTTMQATLGAEATVARSVIANAVTPPEVVVIPQSDDPAVQHEIDKRLSGQHGTIQ